MSRVSVESLEFSGVFFGGGGDFFGISGIYIVFEMFFFYFLKLFNSFKIPMTKLHQCRKYSFQIAKVLQNHVNSLFDSSA